MENCLEPYDSYRSFFPNMLYNIIVKFEKQYNYVLLN